MCTCHSSCCSFQLIFSSDNSYKQQHTNETSCYNKSKNKQKRKLFFVMKHSLPAYPLYSQVSKKVCLKRYMQYVVSHTALSICWNWSARASRPQMECMYQPEGLFYIISVFEFLQNGIHLFSMCHLEVFCRMSPSD